MPAEPKEETRSEGPSREDGPPHLAKHAVGGEGWQESLTCGPCQAVAADGFSALAFIPGRKVVGGTVVIAGSG